MKTKKLLFRIALAISMAWLSAYSRADLVSHWTFDETSGAEAANTVAGAHPGVNTVGGVSWEAGQIGNAVRFDGANIAGRGLIVDSIPGLDGATEMTISFWFNPSAASSVWKALMASTTVTDSAGANKLWSLAWEGGNHIDARVSVTPIDSSNSLADLDTWYHVAMVWDGAASAHSLYINGVPNPATAGNTAATSIVSSGSWFIGNHPNGDLINNLNGLMDDLAVWNEVLTAEQISTIYVQGLAGVDVETALEPNPNDYLISHWTFDETSGTEAANNAPGGLPAVNRVGGLTWEAGQIGNAVRLDGANVSGHDLEIASIPGLTGVNQMSISLWFNPSDVQVGAAFKTMFWSANVNDNSSESRKLWGLSWEGANHVDSRVSLHPRDSSNDFSDTNVWYHVALVWDGDNGSHSLYVNGVKNQTNVGTPSATTIFESGAWYVGSQPSTPANNFGGLIDDIAIWDMPLDADQVSTIFLQGLAGRNAAEAFTEATSESTLISHWTFDETSGSEAANSVAGGLPAVNTGGGISWEAGPIGNAVRLDGGRDPNRDLAIASIPDMTDATELSISLWFNPSSEPQTSGEQWRSLITSESGTDSEGSNRIWGMAWRNENIIDSRASAAAVLSTEVLASTDTWYHVVMTWNGASGTQNLYINGAQNEAASGSPAVTQILTSGTWYIGGHANRNAVNGLKGAFDDVAIWKETLTAAQVSAIYQGGLAGNSAPDSLCPSTVAMTVDSGLCSLTTGNIASVADAGPGTLYQWSITNGTIESGLGTNEIVFTAGATGDTTISCSVEAPGCTSTTGDVIVPINEATVTGSITGPTNITPSQISVVYSVPVTAGSSYAWTVPLGAVITAGQTGPDNNAITVDFGLYSGDITVVETNDSGCVGSEMILAVSTGVAEPTLVSHWTFDETSGTEAANNAPGGLPAVNRVGGLMWEAGQIGNAVRLDGANVSGHDLEIASIPGLTGVNQMSISLWFNPSDVQVGAAFKTMFWSANVNDNSSESRKLWGLSWEGANHIDSRVSLQSRDSSNDFSDTNVWYHVALVWDGDNGSHSLYVNGAKNQTNVGTPSATTILESGAWYVGSQPSTPANNFGGLIDDIAIWKEALSSSQIAAIYQGGLAGVNAVDSLCPSTIFVNADSNVCAGSTGNVASIASFGSAAIYDWSIVNGTITEGLGTNSIVYTAGSAGTTTLNCTLEIIGCSSTVNDDATVTVNALPSIGAISGPVDVDPSQAGVVYSVPATAGSSYKWSLPIRATIVSGATGPDNNEITVDFGQYSGEIAVVEINAAGCVGVEQIISVSTGIEPPVLYVSPTGDDGNAGTFAAPFKTIQAAANAAEVGDFVYIRGGTYRETVVVPTSGTAELPITFQAYGNEEVIVSGADLVTGWTLHSGDIWTASNDWDLGDNGEGNTLFVDGKLELEGRQGAENDPLNFNNWGKIPSGALSREGFSASDLRGFGDDFWNGAKIKYQINDWTLDTGVVADYTSSNGRITFETVFTNVLSQKHILGYYIYDTLNAVDQPGEWFKDRDTNTLYYHAEAGQDPNTLSIEFKSRQHAFDVSGRSHVHIKGITFRGSYINTDDDTTYNVYSGNEFYGYDKLTFVVGSGVYGTNPFAIRGEYNRFSENEVYQTYNGALAVRGRRNDIVNNYMHNLGFNSTTRVLVMSGREHYVGYNTISNFARSFLDGFPLQSEFAYNLIENGANLSWDTGVFDGDAGRGNGGGCIVHHNVIRDCDSLGIYMAFYSGTELVVHHNIIHDIAPWTMRTGYLTYKKFFHNTLIGSAPLMIAEDDVSPIGSAIEASFSNNLQIHLDGMARPDLEIRGNHNYTPADFVDFNNRDLRLAAGSGAIDRGIFISDINDDYSGAAPDAGALEYGEDLWKVGHDFNSPPTDSYAWAPIAGTSLFANGQFASEPQGWTEIGTPTWFDGNAWNTIGKGLARLGNRAYEFNTGDGITRTLSDLKPNTQYTIATEVRLVDELIEAEQFTSSEGGNTVGVHRLENFLEDLDNGDWVAYDSIDFGIAGTYDVMELTYSRPPTTTFPSNPIGLEIRLDSPTGTLLGTFEYNPVWAEAWDAIHIEIPEVAGSHTVYFVAVGEGHGIMRFANARFFKSNIRPDDQLTFTIRDHGDYPVSTFVGQSLWRKVTEGFSFVTGPEATSAELQIINHGYYNAYMDNLAIYEGGPDAINVAPAGMAEQSTTQRRRYNRRTRSWKTFKADNALDGTVGQFSSTKNRLDSWWQVDLGQPRNIYSLKLQAPERRSMNLSNFRLSIWNNDPRDGNAPVWESDFLMDLFLEAGESLVIKPNDLSLDGTTDIQMFNGQFVRIQLNGVNGAFNGKLSIAESEVLDYDDTELVGQSGEIFVSPDNWLASFVWQANLGKIELLNVDDANYTQLSNFKVQAWDRAPADGGSVLWEKSYFPTGSVAQGDTFVIRGDEVADDGLTRLASVLTRAISVVNNGTNATGNNLISMEDISLYGADEELSLTNAALKGVPTQSGRFYANRSGPEDAINSIIVPDKDYSVSAVGPDAWWQVELEKVTIIDQIIVYNNTRVPQGIGDFRVSVWDGDPEAGAAELWGKDYSYNNGDIPAGRFLMVKNSDVDGGVRLDEVAGARVVRISLRGHTGTMSLPEVQVWTADSSIRMSGAEVSHDFDLGTADSPVEVDYQGVSETTHGDVSLSGFVNSSDDQTADALMRDSVSSALPATLNVKVQNGDWIATVKLGTDETPVAGEGTMVWAEGSLVHGPSGDSDEAVFNVTVTDGELNIQFDRSNGGEWEVHAVSLTLVP